MRFDSVLPSGASQTTYISNALPTSSLNNFLASGGPAPNVGGILILEFSIPVTEVGSFFIDDQDEVAVTAFDMNFDPVATVYFDGSPIGFDSWSISYPSGITRVELIGGSLLTGQMGHRRFDLHTDPRTNHTVIICGRSPSIAVKAKAFLSRNPGAPGLTLGGLGVAKRKGRRVDILTGDRSVNLVYECTVKPHFFET